MKAHFRSLDSDNKIDFVSDARYEDNKYIFKDKSLENTNLSIEIIENTKLRLKRFGQTNMEITFILGQKTKGTYNNDMGLFFDFEVFSHNLTIKEKNIYFKYDYYMDDIIQSTHKIWIIIK